jgi:hypothetical protein
MRCFFGVVGRGRGAGGGKPLCSGQRRDAGALTRVSYRKRQLYKYRKKKTTVLQPPGNESTRDDNSTANSVFLKKGPTIKYCCSRP